MISRDGGRRREEDAIAARMMGEHSVVKAICPAIRAMLPAIAPTVIVAIGPEPL
jgi:hypothetical protein